MKKLEIQKGCHIQPYKNKQLEVIRNNEKKIISDGHVEKGDIIQVEDDLAKKILNTIFSNQVIAIEIEEEITTGNDNTEDENVEDENNEQATTNTRRGRKK